MREDRREQALTGAVDGADHRLAFGCCQHLAHPSVILAGAAALALLGTASTACSEPAPRPDVDALSAQLERARSDNELAAAVATTALPQVAKVLTTVAAERAAHAQALTDELIRMNGAALTTTPTTSPSR